jgi:hypothetical protein
MERGKKTGFILRQFKRKSKKYVNKDFFTEFFYLNKGRSVIEFLETNSKKLVIEEFFKEFLPNDLKSFVSLRLLNDMEEKIKTWYYNDENLILVISINWGFKKQEISIDIDMENFIISIIDDKQKVVRDIDYAFFNDYLISFLTLQARTLAQSYDILSKKKTKLKQNITKKKA